MRCKKTLGTRDSALIFALLLVVSWFPVRAAQVSYVIQMSLDGLGSKYLEFYVTNAPAQFPNFARLTQESAFTYNARCDYDISETVPNHASIFTGRPVYKPTGQPETVHHGYNNNFPGPTETLHNSGNLAIPYKSSVFDVTHDYGLSTALLTGKTRLGICERSYNVTNGALDEIGEDNGRGKIDFAAVRDVSGAAISTEVDMLLTNLTSATPRRYTFVHMAEPDLTGHSARWGTATWSNAVRMVDTQLGRILTAIDQNPLLSNHTALLITADHGGGGVTANAHTESYHITNYSVPFILRAPGFAGGSDLYSYFSNRGNPGTNRTDYTTDPQPIRNSDGSNIALALLGLPPIPGSFVQALFVAPTVQLTVARYNGLLGITWPDPAEEYLLQATDAITSQTQWQTITEGIETVESTRVYTVTNAAELPARFFRLGKK